MRKTMEPSPCAAPSSSAKASATKRPCSTSAKRSERVAGRHARFPKWTSPSIRWKARICAPRARPARSRCWRPPKAAACCTRPTATWKRSSSARPAKARSTSTRRSNDNLKNIAKRLERDVEDLVVIVLDRPRHEKLIADIRKAGARIRLIGDGDLSAGIAAAVVGPACTPSWDRRRARRRDHGRRHPLPERLDAGPPGDQQAGTRRAHRAHGHQRQEAIYEAEDLAPGKQMIFAATGVTDGTLMKGVRFFGEGVRTSSVILTLRTGKVRFIDSIHLEKGRISR